MKEYRSSREMRYKKDSIGVYGRLKKGLIDDIRPFLCRIKYNAWTADIIYEVYKQGETDFPKKNGCLSASRRMRI